MTPNPNKDESPKKEKLYLPHSSVQKTSHVKSMKEYKEKYEESINNPDKFWTDFSKNFYFEKEHKGNLFDYNFDVEKGPIHINFMKDAMTNVCYNCLDHHVNAGHGDVVAFYWEGNDPMDCKSITYGQLLKEVIYYFYSSC